MSLDVGIGGPYSVEMKFCTSEVSISTRPHRTIWFCSSSPTREARTLASSDDRDARVISSRMGMTVPEFMNVLGYSSTTEQNISNSSSLVWPKHTELGNGSLFSNLSFIPPPFINRSYKVPTTPIPAPDLNKSTPTIDQVSPGSRTIHTLQKISTSEKSNVASETITLAERHKLWEDLLLSDSEEENEEKPRPRTSFRTIAVETPVDDGDMSVKPGDKSTSESLSILNHALRPPPPFVSPLSILNADGSGTESPIPNTQNGFIDLPQIDINKQHSLESKISGRISEAPTECVVRFGADSSGVNLLPGERLLDLENADDIVLPRSDI
ncbi:unnamed protein product [Schistosoma mattheei]|uniref:Uncharacterized protein n=1 Tax=Schistosoma mattheei TaxID=31246 RepID=A0A183P7M7_9TREM|nr:unnamed protein product [Schistosoma mattheei]